MDNLPNCMLRMAVGHGDTFSDATTDDVVISAENGLSTRSILAGLMTSNNGSNHSLIRLNVDTGLTVTGNITATGSIISLGAPAKISPWGVQSSNTYIIGSNVGVGTTSPSSALEVVGNIHASGIVSAAGGFSFLGQSSISGVSLIGDSSIPFSGVVGGPWAIQGANTFVLNSNVGIGTSTPKNALDVVGNIHASGVISATGGFAFVGDSSLSGVSLIGNSTIPFSGVVGGPWSVQGSNTYVMGSNVGIGTISPKSTLDVLGNIHASGSIVATSLSVTAAVSGIWTLTSNNVMIASGPPVSLLSSWFTLSSTNSYIYGCGNATASSLFSNNVITLPVKGIYSIGFILQWLNPPMTVGQNTQMIRSDGSTIISAFSVPGASASLSFNAGDQISVVTQGSSSNQLLSGSGSMIWVTLITQIS